MAFRHRYPQRCSTSMVLRATSAQPLGTFAGSGTNVVSPARTSASSFDSASQTSMLTLRRMSSRRFGDGTLN